MTMTRLKVAVDMGGQDRSYNKPCMTSLADNNAPVVVSVCSKPLQKFFLASGVRYKTFWSSLLQPELAYPSIRWHHNMCIPNPSSI